MSKMHSPFGKKACVLIFPNISDEEFAILLEYSREHNNGSPDEIANEMISLVELAIKLKALTRKG